MAEGQRLTHTGSWSLNIATRQILHSSAEHTRMFGFDPEKGQPSFEEFLQRVHPEDQEHVLETFQTLMRSGEDLDLRYRIAAPDCPVRYMHAIGHPVLRESSTPGEYVGITIDTTERRRLDQEREQAENRLRRSEAYLAEAQRLSHTGSWALDSATGKIIYYSEEMFRIMGLEPTLTRRTRKQSGSESTLKIFLQLSRALSGLWRLPKSVGSQWIKRPVHRDRGTTERVARSDGPRR